jgi:hypothetical protein
MPQTRANENRIFTAAVKPSRAVARKGAMEKTNRAGYRELT